MRAWTYTLAVLTLITAPVCGQTEQALELVPNDALGFVMVKDLRGNSNKVGRLADRLKVPERVSLLEIIQREMGIRDGLRPNGKRAHYGGQRKQIS